MAIPETGTINWIDFDETKATTRVHIVDGGDMVSLASAMYVVSNCGTSKVQNITTTSAINAAINATYKDAKLDKVIFPCSCASTGEHLNISLPCPKATIFKDDSDREVDMTFAGIVSLVASIKSICTSNSGAAITTVNQGYRI